MTRSAPAAFSREPSLMPRVVTEGGAVPARYRRIGDCRIDGDGPVTRLVLSGEIDLSEIAELERSARLALDRAAVDTLVVDLREVVFADSSALAWLLRCRRRVEGAGGALVVHARPGPVLELLRITGLTGLLEAGNGSAPPGAASAA